MWGNMLGGGAEHLMGNVEGAERWVVLVFMLKIMVVKCVPLDTEPGISLIILTPMKTQMVATSSTCHDVVTFLTQ
jgi:hypothetical protein